MKKFETLGKALDSELESRQRATLIDEETSLFGDLGLEPVPIEEQLVAPLTRIRQIIVAAESEQSKLIDEWLKGNGSIRRLAKLTKVSPPTLTKRARLKGDEAHELRPSQALRRR